MKSLIYGDFDQDADSVLKGLTYKYPLNILIPNVAPIHTLATSLNFGVDDA